MAGRPLLAAAPGARVLELGPDGVTARDDLDLVRDWRELLAAPQRWRPHLSGAAPQRWLRQPSGP